MWPSVPGDPQAKPGHTNHIFPSCTLKYHSFLASTIENVDNSKQKIQPQNQSPQTLISLQQQQKQIQQHHNSPPWYHQLCAGAFAGGTAALVVSPLDVARIRIQIAPKDSNPGLFGANIIRDMIKSEGITSLYSGLPTNMVALVPNWMSYFLAYSQFRSYFNPILVPHIGTYGFDVINALFAGSISTFCTHPFWLVKARFQVQGLKERYQQTPNAPLPIHNTGYFSTHSGGDIYHGTFDAMRKIVKNEGILGLYKGFAAQLLGLIHVGIQFPIYESLKRQLYIYNLRNNDSLDTLNTLPYDIDYADTTIPLHISTSQVVLASSVSKILASCLAYPHEILRSRFQTQDFLADVDLSQPKQPLTSPEKTVLLQKSPQPSRVRYTSILQALRNILKTEGISGLYRGLDVTLLRSVPACVVTFVVYEKTISFLRNFQQQRQPQMKVPQTSIYQ